MPIEAIARDMITPEEIKRGFLPYLSTTNSELKLLNTCTNPTIMVATWPSRELPEKLFWKLNNHNNFFTLITSGPEDLDREEDNSIYST